MFVIVIPGAAFRRQAASCRRSAPF